MDANLGHPARASRQLICRRSGRTQGPSTALRFGRDDIIEIDAELGFSSPTLVATCATRMGHPLCWLGEI